MYSMASIEVKEFILYLKKHIHAHNYWKSGFMYKQYGSEILIRFSLPMPLFSKMDRLDIPINIALSAKTGPIPALKAMFIRINSWNVNNFLKTDPLGTRVIYS